MSKPSPPSPTTQTQTQTETAEVDYDNLQDVSPYETVPDISVTEAPTDTTSTATTATATASETLDPSEAVASQIDEPVSDVASQEGPVNSEEFDYYGACILPVNQSDVKDKDGNNVEVTFAMLAQDAKSGKLTVLGGRPEACDGNNPLKTAVREAYEETIGTFCESVEKGYQDISPMEKDMVHVEYVKTKKPYHIYVLPSELSNGMMGTFQDRRRALEKGKELEHMKGYDKACYSEKSKLVWVPIGAVKDHPKEVSWFTRQIVQAVFNEVKHIQETKTQQSEASSPSSA